MNVGLFVDTQNLHYFFKNTGKKFDYIKLRNKSREYGNLVHSACYGQYTESNADKFFNLLKSYGYSINFEKIEGNKKTLHLVKMAVDILSKTEQLDTIILCTGNGAFLPVIQELNNRHVNVIVIGYLANAALKAESKTYIEIDDTFSK